MGNLWLKLIFITALTQHLSDSLALGKLSLSLKVTNPMAILQNKILTLAKDKEWEIVVHEYWSYVVDGQIEENKIY